MSVSACLPSLKPIIKFIMYGNVKSKLHSSGNPGHGDIVTIGGTSLRIDKSRGRPLGLKHSSHLASSSYSTPSGFRVTDDIHPFSHLTDNESEAVELDSIEENRHDTGGTHDKLEVRHHSVASR